MKNVKNVSLNYVKGFKCVGDINYDLGNLPHLRNGQSRQIDRIKTHQLVTNKRRKIDIPVEVEIVTETESLYIRLNYKLERMQKINDGSSYDCSVREQTLGLITLNFEGLQSGKIFKGKVEEQIEDYMKKNEDHIKEIERLKKESEDERERYVKLSEVLDKESKENDTLRDENCVLTNKNQNLTNENQNLKDENYTLTVRNTQLSNKIVALEKELNTRKNDTQGANMFGNTVNNLDLTDIELRFLVENIIKMNNKGKSEMEIFKKVKDYIGRLKGNKKQK